MSRSARHIHVQGLYTEKNQSPCCSPYASDVLLPSLLQMINISLHTDVFPDILKEARVFPTQKVGPSEDPSNYRPISILPIVSEVTEKHVTRHLFIYLNKYKFFMKLSQVSGNIILVKLH